MELWDLMTKTAASPFAGIFLPLVMAYITWRLVYEYLTPWGRTTGDNLKRDLELLELANKLGFDVSQYQDSCRTLLRDHFDLRYRKNSMSMLVVGPVITASFTLICVALYYTFFAKPTLLFSLSVDLVLVILTFLLRWLTNKFELVPDEESPTTPPQGTSPS